MLDNTILAYVFGFIAGTVGLALARNITRQLTTAWVLLTGGLVSLIYAFVYALPGLGSGMSPVALWAYSTCGIASVTLIAIFLRKSHRTTERPSQYRGKGENNGL